MSDIIKKPENKKLLTRIGERFGVDERQMLSTLKDTAFQSDKEISDEQMIALLIVAEQYKLNPFTREIYAYPDKWKGIVPVVGVDGWSRIINSDPQFDGMEFRQSEVMVTKTGAKPCPEWIECVMYRKDRSHPIAAREHLDECYREMTFANPWMTHTKRFLRHKAMIQTARLAFGFAGIYDPDEADRIQEAHDITPRAEDRAEDRPAQREPKALPEMDEKRFNANLKQYQSLIDNQTYTANALIATLKTKCVLTEAQISEIRKLEPIEQENNNEDS